jgi:Golgi phosphoprotein 3
MAKTLTLADEIVILMLDDETGNVKPDFRAVARVAIAAGALMELALIGRVDSDLQSLFAINPEPVGDIFLDDILSVIVGEANKHPSAWWVDHLSHADRDLVAQVRRRLVRRRLVDAGALLEEGRSEQFFHMGRAYIPSSGREKREVKVRLMSVLFKNEVPDSRDILLLGLVHSTGALSAILSREEMEKATLRIEEFTALEDIGRAVEAVAGQARDSATSLMMALYH